MAKPDLKSAIKRISAETIFLLHREQNKRSSHKLGFDVACTRGITQDQMRAYAEACHKSLRRELRRCKTDRDNALLAQYVLKRLKRSGKDFLNASEF
jgi:hypothetical protein